ncbi:bridge-like lipid transfer protein family member 3A isoform X2 [Monodelphis domestica]|uniref:bridge-like lipid transfer protein family member 3A isoform X2 n=1 Tax=Monodelphis domestica TaxID=13616 RepID=UPI00028BEAE2|nr:bridge-like lipid transfer protein family member 3A isoform X2 [Monodelphis domestica]
MAGIIKKQILKHLSRFTKNLSPDKINLSTLKGEGQLTNLELDEEVLQNVLELPTWLAITRVFCNKASIRIQWTKLKTHPICLCLDKVEVEMRTCEEPRPPNGQSPIALASGQSEYGFAEKVVEGMFIIVNSITIKIHSKAFHASFELWQLQGYSVNPNWQQSDLRLTRITDPHRGEVLTFKELTWQTLRIEADATDSGDQDPLTTPLRLITNQGRIQIALKRRTKDCNVITSKLMFLLDDLLWVLTDSQLKAMMKYAESLSEAMEKSALQRKSLAPGPIQSTSPAAHSTPHSWSQTFGSSHSNSRISQYFEKFDVKESSYHLLISRLDLHICDDSQSRGPGDSANRVMGGAMQLTFRKMAFDYYPFHWAGENCKHWVRHCEAMETRSQWAQKLVTEFQSKIEKRNQEADLKSSWHLGTHLPFQKKSESSSSPHKTPLEKSSLHSYKAVPTPFWPPAWDRLRSSCLVVRVDDLDIHQVSTAGQPRKKPSTLISCNRQLCNLPTQVSAIHIEFTEYYFPDNQELPVPCPNLYMQLNGLTFTLDPISLLWGNLFLLDLYRSLEQFKAIYKLEDSSRQDEHLDVLVDTFQLKLNLPLEKKDLASLHRPQALVISTTTMTATNTRHALHCSCTDLQNIFRSFAATEFFHSNYSRFPKAPGGFSLLHMLFLHHAFQMDSRVPQFSTLLPQRDLASQDLWSIYFTQISLDFEGTENFKGHTLNFVAPFPLSIWICLPLCWQQAQAQKLLLVREGKMKPSASFGSPVQPMFLAPETGSHQRSKTEYDLKSLSGLPEVINALREGNRGMDSKGSTMEMEATADIHVLIHSSSHVQVRLNHYQYLALLRLQEVIQSFQDQLAQDTQAMTGSPLQHQTVCVGVLFPSSEIALLMHPGSPSGDTGSAGSETTSLIDSELSPSEDRELKSDASSDRGPLSPTKVPEYSSIDNLGTLQDRTVVSNSNGVLQDQDPSTQLGDKAHEEETPKFMESSQSKKLSKAQEFNPSGTLNHIVNSDTVLNDQGEANPVKNIEEELTSAIHLTKDATKEALHATMDLTKEAMSLTKDAFSLGRDRMTSTMHKMLFHPPAKEPMAKVEEGGISASGGTAKLRYFSIKRTVSQQSLDGVSQDGGGPEDRLSVDSDGSDSFVMLLESESGLELIPPEQLTPALDDTGDQESPRVNADGIISPEVNSSVSPSKRDSILQPVLVLVLRVSQVALGIEAQDQDLAVALQSEELTLQQPGIVRLWQFLHDQCPESPALKTDNSKPAVALRFEVGPHAAVHSPLASKNGFLHLSLHGGNLELLTSVLTGLGPFLEDEVMPVIIPMQIELLNVSITLKDDSPPVYPTSPGPIPVSLALEHIVVKRDDDGVFHIVAAAKDKPSSEGAQHEKKQQLEEQVAVLPAGMLFGQQVKELPILQKELLAMKQALACANKDKEMLLQEIHKYNPLFQL